MKKQLFIVSVLVVIVSIFVSCSVNSSSENISNADISTTAVTDIKGIIHYYEPVADNEGNILTTSKNQGVYAEIETKSDGKAVTNKNSTYVINQHTTILPIKDNTTKPGGTTKSNSTTKSTTEKSLLSTTNTDADNNIDFKPDKTTEKSNSTTSTTNENPTSTTTTSGVIMDNKIEESTSNTKHPSKIVTDQDGWINKWY